MKLKFKVLFMEDSLEFLDILDEKSRTKVVFNIDRAKQHNDPDLFKKLKDEIWEFRTLFNKNHFRILAFWDKEDKLETLVIATHGIIKKTDKMPIKEIEKAKALRAYYFKNKNKK